MRFADITGGLLDGLKHPFGMAGAVGQNARENPAKAFGLIGATANDINGGNYFGQVGNLVGISKPPEEELGLPGFGDDKGFFGSITDILKGKETRRDEFPGRRVGAATRIF